METGYWMDKNFTEKLSSLYAFYWQFLLFFRSAMAKGDLQQAKHSDFLLQGRRPPPPKRLLLPPKRRLPPKIFKNNRKNNRDNSLLFKKQGPVVFCPPLIFFSSRKPAFTWRFISRAWQLGAQFLSPCRTFFYWRWKIHFKITRHTSSKKWPKLPSSHYSRSYDWHSILQSAISASGFAEICGLVPYSSSVLQHCVWSLKIE